MKNSYFILKDFFVLKTARLEAGRPPFFKKIKKKKALYEIKASGLQFSFKIF